MLLDFLQAAPAREASMLAKLERDKAPRAPLYSTLLYLLTHLRFGERRAVAHWRRITAHRARMRGALGRDPGLRVAVLDYFANVCGELRNPKVIELASYLRTERSAVTDGLTGLLNHVQFMQVVRQELARSRRGGRRVSLLMFDLDDFKRLNDRRGHLEGDRALVKAAAIIRDSVREIDVAARYGGEEFAVLLPDTVRLGAFVVAERVRRRIEERFARVRPPITVSGGIAVHPDDAASAAELLVKADAALYAAKAAGKNRILLPQQPEDGRGGRRPGVGPSVDGPARRGGSVRPATAGLLVSLPDEVPAGCPVELRMMPKGAPVLELRGEVTGSRRVAGAHGAGFDVDVRFPRGAPKRGRPR